MGNSQLSNIRLTAVVSHLHHSRVQITQGLIGVLPRIDDEVKYILDGNTGPQHGTPGEVSVFSLQLFLHAIGSVDEAGNGARHIIIVRNGMSDMTGETHVLQSLRDFTKNYIFGVNNFLAVVDTALSVKRRDCHIVVIRGKPD